MPRDYARSQLAEHQPPIIEHGYGKVASTRCWMAHCRIQTALFRYISCRAPAQKHHRFALPSTGREPQHQSIEFLSTLMHREMPTAILKDVKPCVRHLFLDRAGMGRRQHAVLLPPNDKGWWDDGYEVIEYGLKNSITRAQEVA